MGKKEGTTVVVRDEVKEFGVITKIIGVFRNLHFLTCTKTFNPELMKIECQKSKNDWHVFI